MQLLLNFSKGVSVVNKHCVDKKDFIGIRQHGEVKIVRSAFREAKTVCKINSSSIFNTAKLETKVIEQGVH